VHPVLTVFAKEFRENLRDRRTLFSALILGPLLGPLLFAGALSLRLERGVEQVERPLALAVAYAERAPNLLGYLRQYGVEVTAVDYDADAARAAVQAHRYTQVLAVPPDFAARLAAGAPAPLLLYADSSDVTASGEVARLGAVLNRYDVLITRLRLAARGIDPLVIAPLAVHNIDVATPATRSVLALGTLSYLVLLTTLLGGMYLAIDATAGERERGSLEPLLTVPVRREQLIFGKILATCAYMTLSLSLSVLAFAVVLRFTGLERLGMSVDFGAWVALRVVLYSLPLVPFAAAFMTIVAAYTRSYREAQTWLGLMLLVPTVPLAFAGLLGLRPTLGLMAVPSLSQHFLITSLLRNEAVPAPYLAMSIVATLSLAALLIALAGRLYRREALLG
jgi:sodium transport system permease protein